MAHYYRIGGHGFRVQLRYSLQSFCAPNDLVNRDQHDHSWPDDMVALRSNVHRGIINCIRA